MCSMTPGDAVGELALMYNCPRAATVMAKTDLILWCVCVFCLGIFYPFRNVNDEAVFIVFTFLR